MGAKSERHTETEQSRMPRYQPKPWSVYQDGGMALWHRTCGKFWHVAWLASHPPYQLNTDLRFHFWSHMTTVYSRQLKCCLHQQTSGDLQGAQLEPHQLFGCKVWCQEGLSLTPAARTLPWSSSQPCHQLSWLWDKAFTAMPQCRPRAARVAVARAEASSALSFWLSWQKASLSSTVWGSFSTCRTNLRCFFPCYRFCFAAFYTH